MATRVGHLFIKPLFGLAQLYSARQATCQQSWRDAQINCKML